MQEVFKPFPIVSAQRTYDKKYFFRDEKGIT